jgi:hypothetical protein
MSFSLLLSEERAVAKRNKSVSRWDAIVLIVIGVGLGAALGLAPDDWIDLALAAVGGVFGR